MKTLHKKMIETTFLALGLTLFTACGGGGDSTKTASVDATATTTTDGNTTTTDVSGTTTTTTTPAPATIDTKTRALNIITEYAQTDGGSAVPVAQTYAYAGVVGVGADNVTEFNVVVAGQATSEVDTTEKLQMLLNALGASTEPVAPIAPSEIGPGVEVDGSLYPVGSTAVGVSVDGSTVPLAP